VIQIFTRRGHGRTAIQASSRAGSFGTWTGEASLRGGDERTGFSAAVSRFRSDGTYGFNSGFGNTVGSGLLQLAPDVRTTVTLSARLNDETTHYPTDFTGTPVDRNSFFFLNGTTLGIDVARRFSERAELRLFLASHDQGRGTDDEQDSPADTTGVYLSRDQSELVRRSADLRGTLQLSSKVALTVGGQVEFQRLRQDNLAGFNFGSGADSSADRFTGQRRDAAGYVQAIVDFGPKITATTGARLEDNETFGSNVTWRGGLVYRVTDQLRLRGSAGSAFKEPTFNENFARSAFEVGNPRLDPERSLSWELGFEQDLLDRRVLVGATWFDQHFRDLIQYNGSAPPGTPSYANVARARSQGVEARVEIRPVRALTLRGNYTWLRTRVDDAGFDTGPGAVFVDGERLLRRPAHTFGVDARAALLGRVTLGGAVNHVGSRADLDFTVFPSARVNLAAYTLVEADATVDLLRPARGRPGVAATFRGENLLAEAYQTVVGFPGRGRAMFVGARLGW